MVLTFQLENATHPHIIKSIRWYITDKNEMLHRNPNPVSFFVNKVVPYIRDW